MTNFNVVEKLIGNIRPIGKTEVDAKRLENLKAMCKLMDEIHSAIDAVAHDFKYSTEFSVKKCCDYAKKSLKDLGFSGE